MINFRLEKVIRCAQMAVDCLRASKLVTLGYICSSISFMSLTFLELYSIDFNLHVLINFSQLRYISQTHYLDFAYAMYSGNFVLKVV